MKNVNEWKYLVEEGERLLKVNVFAQSSGIEEFIKWRIPRILISGRCSILSVGYFPTLDLCGE